MQNENIMTKASDHYDNVTLAREHMQNAAAMFNAIIELIDAGGTATTDDAKRLAMMGHDNADIAAGDFETYALMLDRSERGVAQ